MQSKIAWSVIFAFVALCALAIYLTKDAYKLLPRFPTSNEISYTPYENWQSFTPASKTFQVLFPLAPQYASDSVTDPKTKQIRKYDMYVSETAEGTIFMVTVITFQEKPAFGAAAPLIKSLVDDMVKTGGRNQLKSYTDTLYQGFPAASFVIDNQSAGLQVIGRAFIQDKFLFLQSVVGNKSSQLADQAAYFMGTFQLTPSTFSGQVPFPPTP